MLGQFGVALQQAIKIIEKDMAPDDEEKIVIIQRLSHGRAGYAEAVDILYEHDVSAKFLFGDPEWIAKVKECVKRGRAAKVDFRMYPDEEVKRG